MKPANLEKLRELLSRPILDLHGGTRCPHCAGAIGGYAPLALAPLCRCPWREEEAS